MSLKSIKNYIVSFFNDVKLNQFLAIIARFLIKYLHPYMEVGIKNS